jgi:hypothetical protein
MENNENHSEEKYTNMFNKKHKVVSSISNSIFIIHGIVIIIVLTLILIELYP